MVLSSFISLWGFNNKWGFWVGAASCPKLDQLVALAMAVP